MRNLDKYYLEVAETHGKKTAESLEYFYSLYSDSIYKWLARLWDKEIGGFYYSVSAMENEGFYPDIESTSQAFGSLLTFGIGNSYDDYPAKMKDKAVKFITGCQDPEDGYFYHKQWGKNIGTSRRARDMSKGVALVENFGGRPIYPTAIERISEITADGRSDEAASTVPEHLRSKAAFIDYLESLEINKNSYSVGHRIGAQGAEIMAAGLGEVCYDFLNSTQFDNGLWQSELDYQASNGLMKISCAYRTLGKPMPNMLKSFKAAVDIACDTALPLGGGITCVYNPPFTMLNLLTTMEEVGDDDNYAASKRMLRDIAPELLRKTADKVKLFAEPDGSFSYCIGYPALTSQGVKVCVPYLPESDVNANSLANGSRTRTLKVLDIPSTPIFDENDTKAFFELAGEEF